MATAKSWINAARPRTLPLALSGIITGCGLAWAYDAVRPVVSILAIVTATLIQIFSNFANDYGDSQKGTDNQYRVGPMRTVQSGEISQKEMVTGMIAAGGLSLLIGIWLVWKAATLISATAFAIFIGLGILSLIAAYFYTAGKKSYGYVGLGDLAVFLFFGLLPVAGAFYLNAGFLPATLFLPAITIGLFSTGVLNLNNMRDIVNDRQSGKITIPVRLGRNKSRIYHAALIIGGWMAAIVYTLVNFTALLNWLFILTLPLFIIDLFRIMNTSDEKQLDPFLKRLALSTLAFTILFTLGYIISGI